MCIAKLQALRYHQSKTRAKFLGKCFDEYTQVDRLDQIN